MMKYLKLYEDFRVDKIVSIDDDIKQIKFNMNKLQIDINDKEDEKYKIIQEQKKYIKTFVDRYAIKTDPHEKLLKLDIKIPKEILNSK